MVEKRFLLNRPLGKNILFTLWRLFPVLLLGYPERRHLYTPYEMSDWPLKLHGVASLQALKSRVGVGGSELIVSFCSECGEVLGIKVANPEKVDYMEAETDVR